MKCPGCRVEIAKLDTQYNLIMDTSEGDVELHFAICPACKTPIIFIRKGKFQHDIQTLDIKEQQIIFPLIPQAIQLNKLIPEKYSKELVEAAQIIHLSPKASAAISRRALQSFIRNEFAIVERTLYEEIEKIIQRNIFPSYVNETLHAIREIGNFAAHPLKNTTTGDVIEVEPGEADWILYILNLIFEVYFVQSTIHQNKIAQLNAKLTSAGKRTI